MVSNSSQPKPPPEVAPPRRSGAFEQGQMFDPGPRDPSPPLTPNRFLEEAQWHATTGHATEAPNWRDRADEENWAIHSGTAQAATERRPGGGRYYPVRPLNVSDDLYSDAEANAAHVYRNQLEGVDSTDSVVESTGDYFHRDELELPESEEFHEVERGMNELMVGRSIAYENTGEDMGSTSYISPAGSFQTLRDSDKGLAIPRGENLHVQESFTRPELAQMGVIESANPPSIIDDVRDNPRLIEAVGRPGNRGAKAPDEWVSGEDVVGAVEDVRKHDYSASNYTTSRYQGQIQPGDFKALEQKHSGVAPDKRGTDAIRRLTRLE